MIKNIVFDLGGVLIDWNPKYLYTSYFETEESISYFLENICSMEWNEEQDGGRSIALANEILIEQFPEYENEILAYYGEWETMLNGAFEDTVAILEDVTNKYGKPYALTNWSSETFPFAKKHYPFLDWFEGILISGVEKLKKPDPKIYQLLLSKFELNAEECLFIDDNLRNVEAARKEGITSIHYIDAAQLRKALSKHGINI